MGRLETEGWRERDGEREREKTKKRERERVRERESVCVCERTSAREQARVQENASGSPGQHHSEANHCHGPPKYRTLELLVTLHSLQNPTLHFQDLKPLTF